MSHATAQSDTRVVTGRVVSMATGKPVSGALVRSSELSDYSVLTKEDGSYELRVPDYVSSLTVSAPDYALVKLPLPKDGEVETVTLFPATFTENYQENTGLSGVSTVQDFGYTPYVTIGSELQNRLGADVYSITRSGTPGIGNVMFINGLNSLNANAQPLMVVDGVIVDQPTNSQMLHAGFYHDILSNINPMDIERITVMRNGTALYGAKGAAGVVLIETRRNKSMATRITTTLSAGVTTMPRSLDMMNAHQYRTYTSELLQTTNTTQKSFKFLNEDPDYYFYQQYHNETDWTREVYRTAFSQNYGVNVEGGDDVANYNLSLGYTAAQSVLDYNSMNRLNVRFNTDVLFTSRFTMRFDASFTNQTRNLRDDGAPASYDDGTPTSPSFLAHVKSPFLSPYIYANGQLNTNHYDVNDESYLNEALRGYANYNWRLANPYALNEYADAENKNRFENALFNVAITPKLQLGRHLVLSEHFSYQLVSTKENYYIPLYGVPDYYVNSLGTRHQNEVHSLAAKQNAVFSDTRLQWHARHGSHTLQAFGGVRLLWDDYTMSCQTGYDTGNDKTPQIKAGLADSNTTGTGDSWRSVAWYAQAAYNYRQRYYLQTNLTAESSSRFGHAADGLRLFGVQWGVFPGVQASWVMTNEPWFRRLTSHPSPLTPINYLRLSVGYDISGNDDIDPKAARSYFGSRMVLNTLSGLTLQNIGNDRLQWETTRRWNIVLEGNFLGNRLNLRFNYFHSRTENLLTLQQLHYITGLQQNWSNDGAMTNTGFDVHVTARLLTTANWQWEIGASLGHYANQITRLPSGRPFIDTQVYGATIRSQVGRPANLFYGFKTQGVFATSESAAESGLYIMGDNGLDHIAFQAGDIRFVDTDGNRLIDDNDRQVIGDPNPKAYGHLSTTVCYKRLRLDVAFNYSVGNDVYNYFRQQLESGSRFMNQTTALTRRWHGEGHVTDVPRLSFQDAMGNSRFSDRWIEDGSYLKLKTITLSYRLPMNYEFIQGLEFWLQANNVLTLSRYLGGDPEQAITNHVIGQGVDVGLLPQSRQYVLGVKINL